ncbi:hypothetical protein PG997_015251 [Apiospora hydei]|uniref:Uncharacterized protein n=1 Tax=Apiospora hydei TaxID=1337664 RepID=A0ABR1UQ28_9PEZI
MQEHQIGGAKVFDEGLEHKLLIAAALVCQPSMESILGARFPSLEFYEEKKSHSTGSLESGPFEQFTHNNGETPEVAMFETTYSVSGVGSIREACLPIRLCLALIVSCDMESPDLARHVWHRKTKPINYKSVHRINISSWGSFTAKKTELRTPELNLNDSEARGISDLPIGFGFPKAPEKAEGSPTPMYGPPYSPKLGRVYGRPCSTPS